MKTDDKQFDPVNKLIKSIWLALGKLIWGFIFPLSSYLSSMIFITLNNIVLY